MARQGGERSARIRARVLVISAREWFASALAAVLEPEGFAFYEARSGEAGLAESLAVEPDIVLIDVGLPDLEAVELCRRLVDGPLGADVPILIYSANVWQEKEQAEAFAAGAWEILREPVGSRLLVGKLNRLLELRGRLRGAALETSPAVEAGLFSLDELQRTLPLIEGIARRHRLPLSCTVVGPTRPTTGPELIEQRRKTASHCLEHTRSSDLCALLGGCDVAVIACGASLDGATVLAQRLIDPASDGLEGAEPLLSAGIAQFPLSEPAAADLASVESARKALERARAAGGGIRVAEV
jgi:DNA-binding response OmpR family regulator